MAEPCFPKNGKCELTCTCDFTTGKQPTWAAAGAVLDAHLNGNSVIHVPLPEDEPSSRIHS